MIYFTADLFKREKDLRKIKKCDKIKKAIFWNAQVNDFIPLLFCTGTRDKRGN